MQIILSKQDVIFTFIHKWQFLFLFLKPEKKKNENVGTLLTLRWTSFVVSNTSNTDVFPEYPEKRS